MTYRVESIIDPPVAYILPCVSDEQIEVMAAKHHLFAARVVDGWGVLYQPPASVKWGMEWVDEPKPASVFDRLRSLLLDDGPGAA